MISAVLLCGGIGSRLRPITPHYTKSLIPILGEVNLHRIIKFCRRSGVEDIVLIVPPDRINDYRESTELFSNIRIIANYKSSTTNNVTTFATGICNISSESEGCLFIDGDTYISELSVNIPMYSAFFSENREHEWGFNLRDDGFIDSFNRDYNGQCMTGVSYLTSDVINYLKNILINNIVDENQYWEDFLESNLDKVNVIYISKRDGFTIEYDNIYDLFKINGVSETLKLIPGVTDFYSKLSSMTNDNYLVDYNGEKYVIRIPGVGSENLTHRSSEKTVQELLKGMDVTPDVIYLDNLKLSKYMDGYHNWNPDTEISQIPFIIDKLIKIHELGDQCYVYRMDVSEEIRKYMNLCGDRQKMSRKSIDLIHSTILRLKKIGSMFTLTEDTISLVHGDLINSNIMIGMAGLDVKLIDLEYSSVSDLRWDLGDLLSEMSIFGDDYREYSIDGIAKYIANTYNDKRGRNIVNRDDIIAWGAITHFVWSLWGFARTEMGDDQTDYAERRLNMCNVFLDTLSKEVN